MMTEQEAFNKATEGLSDSDAVAAQFGWHAALEWARTQQVAKPKGAPLPTHAAPKSVRQNCDAAVAAITYVLANHCESPIEFLDCWMHGDFDAIRSEWADVPDAVFIGADPLLIAAPEYKDGE